ncbi:MAG: LuxR C-terminal-related transcriptional regulator [Hyphomicrobiaceae bacterium]
MPEFDALMAQKPHHKMRQAFSAASATLNETTYPPTTRKIDATDSVRSLTPKQRKVFSLLSFGFSNKEIAAMMSVAESTIKAHVCAIFQAFGCTNRVQAALIAFSMRQHMSPAELLRTPRRPSAEEIAHLSGFFDR